MFCRECGSRLEDSSRFCPKCGVSILPVTPDNPRRTEFHTNSLEGQDQSTVGGTDYSGAPDRHPAVEVDYSQQTVMLADRPAVNGQEEPIHTPNPVNRRKSHKKLFVVLAVFLTVILLVQQFFSPFLLQKMTFHKLSTLAVRIVRPDSDKKEIPQVGDKETQSIRSYAQGIVRAYSWQLSGHQKNMFRISKKYLDQAPYSKDMEAASGINGNPAVEHSDNPAAGIASMIRETGVPNVSGKAVSSDCPARLTATLINGFGLLGNGSAGTVEYDGKIVTGKMSAENKLTENMSAENIVAENISAGNISAGNMSVGNMSIGNASSGNSNSGGGYSKEQIASDIAGIATIMEKAGFTKLATALLGLAAESNPIDPLILNELAGTLRDQGMNEDAYKLLNVAWRLDPNSPVILTNMGNTCLDMGDKEQAGTWFDMALSIDDNFGLAHEGLMLCYMQDKRYEVAMRHMIKASETVFTTALTRTYDYLQNLDNYEDIRDSVLEGFSMSEISRTYQRTHENAMENVDTPANQIKIPKFPVYTNAENFINGIGGLNDYAMSILKPAMGSLNQVAELAKQADEIIKSFQSGGLSGAMGAADKLGLLKGAQSEDEGGTMQLKVDFAREQFTVSLLSDYAEMKAKKPMDKMFEQIEKSSDPIMQACDRGMRDFDSRGESEEAWVQAMANNWGNSMSFSDSTVSQNKVNINQHIDALYQAVLPTYNELKPVLEEYWLYTGGVIKYCGDATAFQSLDAQRKMTVYGKLANFGIIAEVEAIYVPIAYSMLAVNGEAPKQEKQEDVEKLEEPKEETPENVDSTYSLELWVIEAEWSNGELEIEATALLSGGLKLDTNKGTLTLAGGVGIASPDELPVAGKVQAQYYVCINKSMDVLDHGLQTKTEYSVGEFVKYKVKTTDRISSVTSAMDTTVEKTLAVGEGFTVGAKKTTEEK